MRNGETVTFGGLGGLDRAAAMRSDDARQAALWASGEARVAVLWRGKPMVAGEARDRLALLPTGHPLIASAKGKNASEAKTAPFIGKFDCLIAFSVAHTLLT